MRQRCVLRQSRRSLTLGRELFDYLSTDSRSAGKLSDLSVELGTVFESAATGFTDADLAALPALLTALPGEVDRAARIDRIRAAEAAQGALAAVLIRETAAFAAETRAEHRAAGIRAERAEQGIAAEI